MTDEPTSRLQQAREIIAGLTDREKLMLRDEIGDELADRERARTDEEGSNDSSSAEGSGAWDYQRQPYGRGWIQRERKVRPRKDGSKKVYAYWSFHYIEDGRRKSEHIGSDEKLQQWKQDNPGVARRDR